MTDDGDTRHRLLDAIAARIVAEAADGILCSDREGIIGYWNGALSARSTTPPRRDVWSATSPNTQLHRISAAAQPVLQTARRPAAPTGPVAAFRESRLDDNLICINSVLEKPMLCGVSGRVDRDTYNANP